MRRLLSSLFLCVPLMAGAQDFTTFKGHGGPIMSLDVTQQGTLVSGSFDNTVATWTDGTAHWLDGHDAAVTAITTSPSLGILSGGDDFRVLHWRDDGQPPIVLATHQGKISAIAVAPQGALVATASWDGSIQLHSFGDAQAKEPQTLVGHRSNVTDVAFAPNGTLFSASSDGTVRIWEQGADGLSSRVIANQGFGINRIVVTDTWLAYGALDGATRVIHPVTGEDIADFTLDRRPILSMAHHPQTAQLAIGDGEGYLMMIDTARWQIARDFRAMRQGPVWALAFSTDGAIIHAGGIDDVIYAWPVALLNTYDPAGGDTRSFLRDAETMSNGERQFMRKCSICHSLEPGPSRRAGPTLHGVFGRKAGTVPDYRYSALLSGAPIIWDEDTIDALFKQGPDNYIPGSKMPMQVIAKASDRRDLINFMRNAPKKD
ncbi:c-type cytochrome [Nereida sp. MMG025]|uniref:c-type cytochrome n=1 Tax=Nereida sp. MMG025 TaxID=2909981 RepID=UPI001F003F4C|nr:c-type cytochrome [Nereida sp. MMG025]MCF6444226.1 c-type cytochrome [Nereida sp. MMG025]